MKKILIVLIILSLTFAGVIYFTSGKKINSQVSERGQEFISKKSNDENSDFADADFGEGNATSTKGSTFNVDNCFEFVMEYNIFNQRSQGKCSSYYAFAEPRGSIITYLREAENIVSIDEADGVALRRQEKVRYEEVSKKIGDKSFLIFKDKTEPYHANAYYYAPGYFLVFNLKAATTQNLDATLDKMLESIEILN